MKSHAKKGEKLLKWYRENQRPLPWRPKQYLKKHSPKQLRKNSLPHPYKIWIAEIMLQQTTIKTVLPFYKKFLKKFPTLKSLAQSPLDEILPYWQGLGYYSRVRNLHKSAQLFMERNKGKIPKTAIELENYPGFGFYTSRAVSSQAYGEPVSLLDGNVIRVLCRHEGLSIQWWKKKNQLKLLKIADHFRQHLPSDEFNQALMELGATVCTPSSPSCSLCPLKKNCKASKLKLTRKLPLKKTRKKKEIWLWKPLVIYKKNHIFLTNKHSCPFLKNQWLLPGSIHSSPTKPLHYDFKHHITHHDIYTTLSLSEKKISKKTPHGEWFPLKQISKVSPFSLLNKALKQAHLL